MSKGDKERSDIQKVKFYYDTFSTTVCYLLQG